MPDPDADRGVDVVTNADRAIVANAEPFADTVGHLGHAALSSNWRLRVARWQTTTP